MFYPYYPEYPETGSKDFFDRNMIEKNLFLRRSTEREAKMWMLVVNLVAPRKIKLTDLNLDPKLYFTDF